MSTTRRIAAWTIWPGLLAASVAGTGAGFALGQPMAGFYLTYAALTGALLALERWMPHESAWTARDGQLLPDLGHTLVSTAAVQGMLQFTAVVGLAAGVSLLRRRAGRDVAAWLAAGVAGGVRPGRAGIRVVLGPPHRA